jgi:hypothetical protein
MALHNPDNVQDGERCRVIWEGGAIVQQDISFHSGKPCSLKLSVENPERVWVQSLHPDKVRERVTGDYPNPDAALLQSKLDKAEEEIRNLRAQIAKMREGYEASIQFWKPKNRNKLWLSTTRVEDLPAAIENGEPEQDPEYW